MGYRYKTIDGRAAILQRKDLVRWLGIYLKKLKLNDESESPRKLVYIDETWVESNAKIATGWQKHHFSKFREMAAFSYDKLKVGHCDLLFLQLVI